MPTDWRQLHGDAFEGRAVLVTGGAGFIGSHLGGALVALGARVSVLDDLSHGAVANVPEGARFIEGSITNRSAVRGAMEGAEWVFHEAALGSVPRSVEEPGLYLEVNVRGTAIVLEEAQDAGVGRVMFAASSSAYGDAEALPKHEGMPVRPQSPYAATKVAGEALMRAWAHSYGVDAVSLRYFNIFGPRQNANSAYAAVIAAFAAALLEGRRPVIYGDGSQSRDFTHVDNAVHANLLAARRAGDFRGEVINVACGGAVSVAELARRMAGSVGRPDLVAEHLEARVGDVMHSLASLEVARRELGYAPVVGVEEGLEETTGWYREVVAGG